MSNVTNKAMIQPIPTDVYIVSSNDVLNYLENQLGFKVGADFTRWTGVTPDHSYVRMRVVMAPKDILAQSDTKDYVDRVLSENAAGLKFKDTVIETLKPFMYPKTVGNLRNHPEDLQRMYQYGLYGERLDEVIQNAQLNYAKEAGYFRIYLRPERIIADMLANPATNAIDGSMVITAVHGTSSETLRWEVAVTRSNNINLGADGISLDKIFNNHNSVM